MGLLGLFTTKGSNYCEILKVEKNTAYKNYNIEALIKANDIPKILSVSFHIFLKDKSNINLAIKLCDFVTSKGFCMGKDQLSTFYLYDPEYSNPQKALELALDVHKETDRSDAIAKCYEKLGNVPKQLEWWLVAAESGKNEAYLKLGLLHEDLNPAEAKKYYLLAGQNGDSDGYHILGMNLCDQGAVEEGIEYLIKADEMGNVNSAAILGYEYQKKGMYDAARHFLVKGANNGDANAQGALARFILDGYGTNDEAIYWLKECFKNGGTSSEGFNQHLGECLDVLLGS